MSEQKKPRAVIAIAIFDDGNVGMTFEGKVVVPDLLLAAKFLDLEAEQAYGRLKMQQSLANRSPLVVPQSGPQPINGRG